MHTGKDLEAHWVQKGCLSCDSDAPQVRSARPHWTRVVNVNRHKTRPHSILIWRQDLIVPSSLSFLQRVCIAPQLKLPSFHPLTFLNLSTAPPPHQSQLGHVIRFTMKQKKQEMNLKHKQNKTMYHCYIKRDKKCYLFTLHLRVQKWFTLAMNTLAIVATLLYNTS
jgi:hypothetical protein